MAHLPKGKGVLLPPFQAWLASNIPAVYDNTMSYYEELCALIKYLQDIVVPALNENAAAITTISEAMERLQKYVDEYFDNLDVQEEINNKLDEMAEDGQLTDIIAQYLQLAGVIAFNTLSDLKNAENIANGSICRTLGKSSYNDGHGEYYKIRPITSGDNVDDLNIVALQISETLIAERVTEAYDWTNPITFGADPTGVNDSATAINNCIIANLGGSINFTGGTYKVNSPILTPYFVEEQVNINFNGSIIKAGSSSLSYVIGVGMYNNEGATERPNHDDYATPSSFAVIDNVKIDGNGCAIGILTHDKYWYPRIVNSSITNCVIGVQAGSVGGESTDLALDNCYIECTSYKDENTIGLLLNGNDNKITNCRIYNGCTGVKINGSGNFFINDHIYLYGHLNDRSEADFSTYWDKTKAVVITGNDNRFNSVYTDSYHKHYCLTYSTRKSVDLYIINSIAYSNVTGHDDVFIDASGHANFRKLSINNTNVTLRSDSLGGSSLNRGIIFDSEQNFETFLFEADLTGNNIMNIEKDILLIDTNKNTSVPYSPTLTMEANKYYVIGYIPFPVGQHSVTMRITNTNSLSHQVARIWCNLSKNMTLNAEDTASTGTDFGIGLTKVTINGMDMAEVSVMRKTSYSAKFGIEVFPYADNFGRIIPLYNGLDRLTEFVETTPSSTVTFGF